MAENENSRRGIDSIAHLFLSGAAPGRPERKGPGDNNSRESPVASRESESKNSQPEKTVSNPQPEIMDSESQDPRRAAQAAKIYEIGVLAYHLPQPALKLEQYLRNRLPDGKILIEDQCLLLDETGVEDELELCQEFTVICTPAPDDIITTYRNLKSLHARLRPEQQVSLFVCNVPDEETGTRIYQKITQATEYFLGLELGWAGCQVRSNGGLPIANRENPSRGSRVAELESETGAAGDELRIELPKVDQCDARSGEAEKSVQDRARPMNHFAEKKLSPGRDSGLAGDDAEQAAQTPANPQSAIHTPQSAVRPPFPVPQRPIIVGKLPAQDQELLGQLLAGLPGALAGAPGALPVPLLIPSEHAPAAVLLDNSGRLRVMLADLGSAEGLLERALAVRQWLSRQLPQMQNHYPQLCINSALPIGLLLVAQHHQHRSDGLIGDIPLTLLKLTLLQWPGGNGLLLQAQN